MIDQLGSPGQWEREALNSILLEHVKEQRRTRRWGIFFKFLGIIFILGVLYGFYNREIQQPVITTQAHTAMIDIVGDIGAAEEANADNLRDSLKLAFENKQVKGVILRINSPGGSPVQAREVYNYIRELRSKYPDTKVYAAIRDMGASAAYLIACAADSVYSDKTSIVGSIGAKIDSFGFVDTMHKVGVERRLYASGKHKGILDPFLPRTLEEDAFINEQLRVVLNAFVENVREGRGERLRETPEIFSGLFWSGEQALNLGLIDGYGDAHYIAREIIKTENLVDYSPSTNFLDRFARRVGASMGSVLSLSLGLTKQGVR